MNFLWEFLTDPANWSGAQGIPTRVLEHVEFTFVAFLVAAVIGLPLGLLTGHTGRGARWLGMSANAARALPTLGLVMIIALGWPLNAVAVLIPLVLLAMPSIMVNTYEGIRSVDPDLRDAAGGMGLTGPQILFRVSIPVALPLILMGMRSAAVQIVATVTIASFVGLGGLGRYIALGLRIKDFRPTIGGAVLVIVLALAVQALFVLAQRLAVSPGVRAEAG